MKQKMISAAALSFALLAMVGLATAQSVETWDGTGTLPSELDPASTGVSNDVNALPQPEGFSADKIAQDLGNQTLGGDEGTACEAILCLATGSPPHECAGALMRYFSITDWRLDRMIRKRLNFLQLCPTSDDTPQMSSLVNAMAHGAGRCDATSLNQSLAYNWGSYDSGVTYISDQMPDYCGAYFNHEYTDIDGTRPQYVGTPEAGGFWADGQNYAAAVAEYEARQAAIREQQQNDWYGGGY